MLFQYCKHQGSVYLISLKVRNEFPELLLQLYAFERNGKINETIIILFDDH